MGLFKSSKRRIMDKVRAHFKAIGYPVSDLTDDEITSGLKRIAVQLASFGLTVEDATPALRITEEKS